MNSSKLLIATWTIVKKLTVFDICAISVPFSYRECLTKVKEF